MSSAQISRIQATSQQRRIMDGLNAAHNGILPDTLFQQQTYQRNDHGAQPPSTREDESVVDLSAQSFDRPQAPAIMTASNTGFSGESKVVFDDNMSSSIRFMQSDLTPRKLVTIDHIIGGLELIPNHFTYPQKAAIHLIHKKINEYVTSNASGIKESIPTDLFREIMGIVCQTNFTHNITQSTRVLTSAYQLLTNSTGLMLLYAQFLPSSTSWEGKMAILLLGIILPGLCNACGTYAFLGKIKDNENPSKLSTVIVSIAAVIGAIAQAAEYFIATYLVLIAYSTSSNFFLSFKWLLVAATTLSTYYAWLLVQGQSLVTQYAGTDTNKNRDLRIYNKLTTLGPSSSAFSIIKTIEAIGHLLVINQLIDTLSTIIDISPTLSITLKVLLMGSIGLIAAAAENFIQQFTTIATYFATNKDTPQPLCPNSPFQRISDVFGVVVVEAPTIAISIVRELVSCSVVKFLGSITNGTYGILASCKCYSQSAMVFVAIVTMLKDYHKIMTFITGETVVPLNWNQWYTPIIILCASILIGFATGMTYLEKTGESLKNLLSQVDRHSLRNLIAMGMSTANPPGTRIADFSNPVEEFVAQGMPCLKGRTQIARGETSDRTSERSALVM